MPQSPSTASLGNPPRAWAQRWRALPRDVRDTLFLLLVIAWVVAPHVQHIPLWCSALAVAVLLGRAYLALQGRPLPGLRLRQAVVHYKLFRLKPFPLRGNRIARQTCKNNHRYSRIKIRRIFHDISQ